MEHSINENLYQRGLIKRIKKEYPGCLVLKNDSSYIQGIPDILILYKDKWAMLEVKKSASAPRRPNQEYYISKLKSMSYADFIYPENEAEVLNGLRKTFRSDRPACDTERK